MAANPNVVDTNVTSERYRHPLKRGSMEDICRLLERFCPETWKAITAKRYQLPDYRVADYANQIALNKVYVLQLWQVLTDQVGSELNPADKYLMAGVFMVNQILGLKNYRPVYFLKPDHGAALMRTALPADLSFSDIRWRHSQLRIMLPLNLVRFYDFQSRTESTCVCIDLARTGSETAIYYPEKFAQELDLLPNLYRIRQEFGWGLVEETRFIQKSARIAQVITSEPVPISSDHRFSTRAYSITEESFKDLLNAQERFDLTLQELVDKNLLHERMAHLGLQCLLYMSREEEEVTEEVIRSPSGKGKRFISSIVRARFVDEYCHKVQPGQARVIASYQAERSSPAAHWVRGHWRRQHFGIERVQSKLIWIRPYQTTEPHEHSIGTVPTLSNN